MEFSKNDSGLFSLIIIARYLGVKADPQQLIHDHGNTGRHFNASDILLTAKNLGLQAKKIKTVYERLKYTSLPAIMLTNDGRFLVLAKLGDGEVLLHDPSEPRPKALSETKFDSIWNGELILLASRESVTGKIAKFDFSWFIPAIIKYRKLLGEILLISFVLNLLSLATPIFFQVVMDKVLVHRSLSTLDVIGFGLLVVSVFEVLLSGLRTYVFSHTTSRIDVELGAKIFRHLLALPASYFQARRVGDSVARVRELENIRNFLTNNSITLVIDLFFSIVFIAVMFMYSGWLTLVVIFSLPLYGFLSFFVTPVLRHRLNEKFDKGAENQSFLVESLSGIDTVKSMAVEPLMTRKWDNQLASYVRASFRSATTSTIAREGVSLIGKLVVVANLWIGAKLVIDGNLTVGQLIAFNMLAGRVAQPIMRLSQMWTDFQQVGISMERLGDILNARTELVNDSKSTLPRLIGGISFDAVHFRYTPDSPEILQNINLNIQPGEIIGIVGRSGSGKSTLTKLIQRLYVPEKGRVAVDGIDISQADTASLRRQIGVVLQDNVLFNQSIENNIALATPGASLDTIINAAKLSGAHEFVSKLREGYNTIVGEHGSGLSGGQQQRIAIARALMNDPRILIFDEATSALDYESEKLIQDNMKAMANGRTVIIIAHRLSSVRQADRILVMDEGEIVEEGKHNELLKLTGGIYAKLHKLQAG